MSRKSKKGAAKKSSKKGGESAAAAKKSSGSKSASKKPGASKTIEPKISLEDLFPPDLKASWETEAVNLQRENILSARDAYRRRGLVLYIGAGISCSVGLPSWWDMIRALTVTMMTRRVGSSLEALKGFSEEQKALARIKIQEEVAQGAGADKSILIMARAIKDFFGDRLPHEVALSLYRPFLSSNLSALRRLLFKAGGQPGGSLTEYQTIRESKLFRAIVQLARAQRDVRGVQAIVNFNYDDLIEESMREQGIRCDTLLSGREESRDASLPCYHVHGVLPFRKIQELRPTGNNDSRNVIGNFVFSEDEYHTEYSDPYRWSNMTMINQLGRYSGLFVGLSLQDPNLRRLLDVTHRQYPEITNYAILTRNTPRGQDAHTKQSILRDMFEKVETESFANIGVHVIWTDKFEEVPDRILEICDIDADEG